MNANIKNANMQKCRAFGCNFTGADSRSANLNEANVNGANFSRYKLQGSVMTCKDIAMAIFKNATYDDSTIWPKDFDYDKAGCLKVNYF